MELLSQILDQTGAKIVLSSAWRSAPNKVAAVNTALRAFGLDELWSCTPTGGFSTRAEEIVQWLLRYAQDSKLRLLPIEALLIVDDACVGDQLKQTALSGLKAHVLQTAADAGLSHKHVLRATAVLGRRFDWEALLETANLPKLGGLQFYGQHRPNLPSVPTLRGCASSRQGRQEERRAAPRDERPRSSPGSVRSWMPEPRQLRRCVTPGAAALAAY